jgi:hypothetical protein
MLSRRALRTLQDLARGFPIVAITGPRQSGMTTLAWQAFAALPYVNLDDLDTRERAGAGARWCAFVGEAAANPLLVYGGDDDHRGADYEVLEWRSVGLGQVGCLGPVPHHPQWLISGLSSSPSRSAKP